MFAEFFLYLALHGNKSINVHLFGKVCRHGFFSIFVAQSVAGNKRRNNLLRRAFRIIQRAAVFGCKAACSKASVKTVVNNKINFFIKSPPLNYFIFSAYADYLLLNMYMGSTN